MADSYYQMAIVINNNLDNNYEAIKNFFKALRLYEEIGNKSRTAQCFATIGFAYFVQENYKAIRTSWSL